VVLVDSCVWIEAGKARGDALVKASLRSLLEENEAAWCGVTKLEVVGGARPEQRGKLEYFFETIPYLGMTESIWDRAKEVSWCLRDQGVAVPWNDILLLALAREKKVRLYSIDGHFSLMQKHVALLLYEPGYGGSFAPEN
jgi:predicted nucleic acid-binding protein